MGWDLMHGQVVELDRSDLASHVEAAGVAVVNWRERGNLQSHLLDRAIESSVTRIDRMLASRRPSTSMF